MTCKILLDENVYHGDLDIAEGLKLELESRGLDVAYVGQPGAGFGRWYASPPNYPDDMMDIITHCHKNYIHDKSRMKQDKAVQKFKHCVNVSESEITPGPRKPLSTIPPKGTRDLDVRKFAELQGRIIVSEDIGRDLESRETDRIALGHSDTHTATEILDRLKDVGQCQINRL